MSIDNILGEPAELPQPTDTPAEKTDPAPTPEAPATEEEHEPKVVPLAALHEERGKRRELAAQVAAEKATRAELENRFEQRLQALARAAQSPPPAAPDFTADPAGHLKHQLDTTQQQLHFIAQRGEQERQQAHMAETQARTTHAVQQDENAFVTRQPDYPDAVKHLHVTRVRELQALGNDEFSAERQSASELQQFAMWSVGQGRSPSQTAYALAIAKGYTTKKATTPGEQMAMAQKGAAAAKSLGSGGSHGGQLTAQQLLSMPDEEFAEATKGNKWQKLMGG